MDYETAPAPQIGHSLRGLTVNLLVRDVLAELAFLAAVFGLTACRSSADFALLLVDGQPFQLHSDRAYGANPLLSLLPEAGPRGGGIELRLHEVDPDSAVQRLSDWPEAVLLQAPIDKPGHGLREAIILCPAGYAWVPSRRI